MTMQFCLSQVSVLRLCVSLVYLANTCSSLRSSPSITFSVLPAQTLTAEMFLRHFTLMTTKALKVAATAGTQVQLFLSLFTASTLT